MLIRVRGAYSGIEEYLKKKTGSSIDRDALDERVPLYGDLDVTGEVIKQIERNGQRYLHISASFTEELSIETMRKIEEEMRIFFSAAFKDDELAIYSEAHIPKIQFTIDPMTGDKRLRLYHFHMIIPKTSMLYGGYENPVGNYMYSVKYFQALQNFLNTKYGLESPVKGHGISSRSDVISTYNRLEEAFKGQSNAIDFKIALLKTMLENDLTYDDLKQYLETLGEVKIRKAGKPGEYLWIKPSGAKQGINLNDTFFMPSFANRSKEEKEEYIEKEYALTGYRSLSVPQEPKAQDAELVDEWYEFRSREIRFLRNRRMIREYHVLEDKESKQKCLRAAEELYFSKKSKIEDSDLPDAMPSFRVRRGLRLKSKKTKKTVTTALHYFRQHSSKQKEQQSNNKKQACPSID